MASVIRATALRAGGACVRCRKGKTKCVYENGRAPCKNCAKGMHECYLPSESMSHGGHGVSPARIPQRTRESLPSDSRANGNAAADRAVQASSAAARHSLGGAEKLTPELMAECERVISKTLPACVAFHKPSFLQQVKNASLDPSMVHALLTTAARHSPNLIRRYGGHGGGTAAAEHFAQKAINFIMQSLDHPSLGDIQALCLLVIHEWGCRNAVRAYIYLGQAARMAQMFRIVQTHQPSDPDNFLKEEAFRRTLWLIYILDCFLTSSPGRHPALSSLDIADVALPCQDMNFNFGSPVFVRTLSGVAPGVAPDPDVALADVGEFAYIVLATKAWRSVVEMMTTTTIDTFSEARCADLEAEIDAIRTSLPVHFADKPGQITLHVTMGSGFTYAMIHCLLHCATIFVNRRQILQFVTAEDFNADDWRASAPDSQLIDKIFAASHSIISMLVSLENGADKDSILCFPIVMLFSAFTAGSTVAYLYLKGLAPASVVETASHIVRDSLRLMNDGAESWPLVMPWNRHLTVMAKVLRDMNAREDRPGSPEQIKATNGSPYLKDDGSSQPDTNPDTMDYDQPATFSASQEPEQQPHNHQSAAAERSSEPPPPRRPGIATINGGSAGALTPATTSPPPQPVGKIESPEPQSTHSNPPAPTVDITAKELCSAFERQLLELDDLAAFMGGGV
ncbi:fungal specific transcription factor domain containing protein [Niveomyces insectorum RCEF 264]|uniref:Fungal specific transcription factor domain containing protein n=1 Tax=Niveomyces insectorum RCEF 264 TaxID=1081102 RepID=A0A167Z5E9_9HYPO|nr:fungal specific transcription factor domain containing protein [Niveomyces insectorum RCEF 264]